MGGEEVAIICTINDQGICNNNNNNNNNNNYNNNNYNNNYNYNNNNNNYNNNNKCLYQKHSKQMFGFTIIVIKIFDYIEIQ